MARRFSSLLDTTPTTGAPPTATPSSAARRPAHWAEWRVHAPSQNALSQSGWQAGACPQCGRVDQPITTLLIHDAGAFYCARCGHHGNANETPARYRGRPCVEALLHTGRPKIDMARVLSGMGLAAETVLAAIPDLSIGHGYFETEDTAGWEPCVLLPVRAPSDGAVADVVLLRFDRADGRLLGHRRAAGGTLIPWGLDQVPEGSRVVIVEHPLDAMALRGAGEAHVIALPDAMNPGKAGGGDWSGLALPEVEAAAKLWSDVVIAFRDTEENHRFEEELGRRLGRERCRRTRWHGHRPPDAGQPGSGQAGSGQGVGAAMVVAHAGPEAALACLADASPFPIAGIHELMDVDERFELLYEFGLQPGLKTGWPSLDMLYTVKPGQWTVVTGIPSHGKSTFLDAMLVNLARFHDWKFGLFSPENQPIERHFAGLMEKALGAPFNEGRVARITPEQKNACKTWLNQHFKVILPSEDNGNWSLDGVLDLARVLVYRDGIRGLVIDPWNELDHSRPNNLTETEHISLCLTKVRRFARLYGVHVWVVAHPTKLEPKADGKYPVPTPYSISGGAHWRNKADNALAIYRNVGELDDDIADIHVQKVRFKEIGRVGRISLRSDPVCGRYHDDLDQDKRARALGEGRVVRSDQIQVAERISRGACGILVLDDAEDPLRSAYD